LNEHVINHWPTVGTLNVSRGNCLVSAPDQYCFNELFEMTANRAFRQAGVSAEPIDCWKSIPSIRARVIG